LGKINSFFADLANITREKNISQQIGEKTRFFVNYFPCEKYKDFYGNIICFAGERTKCVFYAETMRRPL